MQSVGSETWGKLIGQNIFDDYYPHRINACFRYLDEDEQGVFSLKDLIQRGPFVFNYLCIDVEEDSSFAIMDIFRSFDRSGRGNVNIEEFVIGIMDKIISLKENSELLEDIAQELIAVSPLVPELLAKLDKGFQNEKRTKYKSYLGGCHALIGHQLKSVQRKVSDVAFHLTPSLLVNTFLDALERVILDSQVYFHISNHKMSNLLADIRDESIAHHSKPHHTGSALPPATSVVWNLFALKDATTKNGGEHATEIGVDHDSTPVTPSSRRYAAGASAVSASSSSKSHRGGAAFPGVEGGGVAGGGEGGAGVGRAEDNSLLNGEDMVLESGQIVLLQNTLRTMDNFFDAAEYACAAASDASDGGGNGEEQPYEYDQVSARHFDAGFRLRGYGVRGNEGSGLDDSSSIVAAASAAAAAGILVPLKDGGGGAGLDGELLMRNLFETQEALRRAKMRSNLLELVQVQIIDNNNTVNSSAPSSTNPTYDGDVGDTKNATTGTGAGRNGMNLCVDVGSRANTPSTMGGGVGTGDASYEGIMAELSILKACLAERAAEDFPFGHMLQNQIAIVDTNMDYVAAMNAENNNNNNNNSSSSSESKQLQQTKTIAEEKEEDTNGEGKTIEMIMDDVLTGFSSIGESVANYSNKQSEFRVLKKKLSEQEEQILELKSQIEQSESERSEVLSLTVELQVLREKNQKYMKEDINSKVFQKKNSELYSRVRQLEEQLEQAKEKKTNRDFLGNTLPSDSKKMTEMQEKNTALERKVEQLGRDSLQHLKENQRLKTSMALAEQRVKSALQDQMTLHNQIQSLEEEAASAKANITKLTRDLDESKFTRGHKDEMDRKISELIRQVHSLTIDLEEARAGSSIVNKLQTDLLQAETLNQNLQNKLEDFTVEVQKGAIAVGQLDSLREQLRVKTKENRDMTLHMHGLESQLRDVPYLQRRFNELSEELSESKMKTDKIPGLLSEIARLRGSSRASVKALLEQDKQLAQMKIKVKQLDSECLVLKKENRLMRELETKLNDANAEVKRLMDMAAEVTSLKAGLKQQEEEKKAIVGQNKKMKNLMRKASVVQTAFNPTTGGGGTLVGGVGGGGPGVGGVGGGGGAGIMVGVVPEASSLNDAINASVIGGTSRQQPGGGGGGDDGHGYGYGHGDSSYDANSSSSSVF